MYSNYRKYFRHAKMRERKENNKSIKVSINSNLPTTKKHLMKIILTGYCLLSLCLSFFYLAPLGISRSRLTISDNITHNFKTQFLNVVFIEVTHILHVTKDAFHLLLLLA